MTAISSPVCYNITCASANTEYSQVLPTGAKLFDVQARNNIDIRFAFETGKVATPTSPYMTLKSSDSYYIPYELWGSATLILYIAHSEGSSQEIELLVWR